ncbi:MAG: RIP metalloprotease RseP [Lentisphaerae bacterium]|nr:RIP metalloprotease RseP [Lentisphaerota bacterium]
MATSSFLAFLGPVLSGVGVLFLFSLAVFIHELGHFLAARWMGLTIDVFSIGFGPALWKRKVGATEYRVSAIPFGGYVALPQLDPSGMETIQGKHEGGGGTDDEPAVRRLKDIAPWRRIVVSVAGPLGNILLAIALAWIVFLAPAPDSDDADPTIGTVDPASPAFAAGLRPGDRIASINSTPIHNWNDFLIESHLSGDASNGLAVVVQRDGEPLALLLPVTHDKEARIVRVEGIAPRIPCVAASVATNSPAQQAGLLPGDEVRLLDGVPVAGPDDLIARITAQGAVPVRVGVRRGHRDLELTMTPRFNAEAGRHLIGIVFESRSGTASQWMQYRRPWQQLKNDAAGVVRILRALVAPRTKGETRRAASGLSGPLVIVVLLYYQVRAGLIVALAFLRFLCVNLALLNLLPLPVLDGGHIVFACYEIVTRRKPNARLVGFLSNVFAVLLIGLMVLLLFRDTVFLKRMFGTRDAPVPEHAAPAAGPAAATLPDGPAVPDVESP